ncbi:MAG: fumarate reductase/succinate dehydrogenase flavoprotein subunit [Bdellovibrionales bacterium]|nr:fumarate reductase/succinate dehydrogenase flavoprotein subunit [Bdellovibrionales bacterium]
MESKIPSGSLSNQWSLFRRTAKLVNPSNRRKYDIIIVGAGLAGASASASLGELGYSVKTFFMHDSPRRAHSIAAQGGINAAKNYPNDGDSIERLFYDTIKGGDFRARESNVYRLAEISNHIIDHCVAQGVPFAREYGGLLDNRSFGGAQVARTFYARGQTGQQLLLGAYSSLMKQVDQKRVQLYPRREMLDLIVENSKARGITVRNLITGEIETYTSHAVLLCTGGYGNAFYLSTNALHSNVTAAWRCHKKGAYFANPCFTQIHPTCIPRSHAGQSKLTLMSESLRNDGRVWVPKKEKDPRKPQDISESERDYYLERIYPSFGNLVPRDVASRQAKFQVDKNKGVGPTGEAVYLDFSQAIKRDGKKRISEKYGNLFQMYQQITGEDPYQTPMRIFPAVHYTMGGLWVDYELQSTIPGLFVLGEANFSDHGANRLGASALMQGLADGYFIIPVCVANYLSQTDFTSISETALKKSKEEQIEKINSLLKLKGDTSIKDIHKKLGEILWNHVGMVRNKEGLLKAISEIQKLREEFWNNTFIPGEADYKNAELERALRVSDYLELGELMALDALQREESCGSHFRTEYQSSEQEALRDDEKFCHVSAWEHTSACKWTEHREKLSFEEVTPSKRSYK